MVFFSETYVMQSQMISHVKYSEFAYINRINTNMFLSNHKHETNEHVTTHVVINNVLSSSKTRSYLRL